MKVMLDIKDNKADFVMELLHSLSFVKVEPISPTEAQFFKELKASKDFGIFAHLELNKK